jgi:polyisoprenyl-teichoic acid--peptidoglycan teichoic acid transferase
VLVDDMASSLRCNRLDYHYADRRNRLNRDTDGDGPASLTEIVLALVVPGWVAFDRRRALAVVLLALGVALPFGLVTAAVAGGRSWVALSVDEGFLLWTAVVLAAAFVTRLVALIELWWESRQSPEHGRERWMIVVAVAVSLPLALGAGQVLDARHDLQPVFTSAGDGGPLFDPDRTVADVETDTTPAATAPPPTLFVSEPDGPAPDPDLEPGSSTTTTVPPKPARPVSGVDPTVVADVRTILLLGGDAGPGRSGLRTDTMMLFSIHPPSGRAALVSIPRDLRRMLFPPGSELERRYPYGWDDLANAIYPIVSANNSLRAAYEVEGVRAGVVALAHAVGYSLDVTIDDYVLVDMQGFLELIDAIGGVTVNVTRAVPMPGNVPGAPTQYPDTIGPGIVQMDGTTALGYVRSRKADTDYQRTRRQRELLAALATQLDLTEVITSFPRIADAVGGTLRTSLTPDELADTLAVIGGETAIVESVGLVPPLVNVNRPDYQRLAEIVGAVRVAIATGVPSGF